MPNHDLSATQAYLDALDTIDFLTGAREETPTPLSAKKRKHLPKSQNTNTPETFCDLTPPEDLPDDLLEEIAKTLNTLESEVLIAELEKLFEDAPIAAGEPPSGRSSANILDSLSGHSHEQSPSPGKNREVTTLLKNPPAPDICVRESISPQKATNEGDEESPTTITKKRKRPKKQAKDASTTPITDIDNNIDALLSAGIGREYLLDFLARSRNNEVRFPENGEEAERLANEIFCKYP